MSPNIDLDRVTRAIDRLPAVPAVVHEINQIIASPSASAAAVARAVERDQIVTVKLLRLANSAFFGCRGRVGSVTHAVILMGFNLLRNVVLSCALKSALGSKGVMGQEDLERFWDHAFACGLLARQVAAVAGMEEQDEAFLAGLLHDVGQIVLASTFGEQYLELLHSAPSEEQMLKAETESLGIGHPLAGKLLAEKWNLPKMVCGCIAEHHRGRDGFSPTLPYLVRLGESLSCQLGHGGFCACGGRGSLPPGSWPAGASVDLEGLKRELDQALAERDSGAG